MAGKAPKNKVTDDSEEFERATPPSICPRPRRRTPLPANSRRKRACEEAKAGVPAKRPKKEVGTKSLKETFLTKLRSYPERLQHEARLVYQPIVQHVVDRFDKATITDDTLKSIKTKQEFANRCRLDEWGEDQEDIVGALWEACWQPLWSGVHVYEEVLAVAKENHIKWTVRVPGGPSLPAWGAEEPPTPTGLLFPTMGDTTKLLAEATKATGGPVHVVVQDASGIGKSKVMFTLAELGFWSVSVNVCGRHGDLTPYWQCVASHVNYVMKQGGKCGDNMQIGDAEWIRRVNRAQEVVRFAVVLPIWIAASEVSRRSQSVAGSGAQTTTPGTGTNFWKFVEHFRNRLTAMKDNPTEYVQLYASFAATPIMTTCCRYLPSLLRSDDLDTTTSNLVVEVKERLKGQKLFFAFDELSSSGVFLSRTLPRRSWMTYNTTQQRTLVEHYGPGLDYHIRRVLIQQFGEEDRQLVFVIIGCSPLPEEPTVAPLVRGGSLLAVDAPKKAVVGGGVACTQNTVVAQLLDASPKGETSPTKADKVEWTSIMATLPPEARRALEWVVCSRQTPASDILDRPRYFVDHYLVENPESWQKGVQSAVENMMGILKRGSQLAELVAVNLLLNRQNEELRKRAVVAGMLTRDSNSTNTFLNYCLKHFLLEDPDIAKRVVHTTLQTSARTVTMRGEVGEIFMNLTLVEHCQNMVPIKNLVSKRLELQTNETDLLTDAHILVKHVVPALGLVEQHLPGEGEGWQPHDRHGTDHMAALLFNDGREGRLQIQTKVRASTITAQDALASLCLPYLTNKQRGDVMNGKRCRAFHPRDSFGRRLWEHYVLWKKANPAHVVVNMLFFPAGASAEVIDTLNAWNRSATQVEVHVVRLRDASDPLRTMCSVVGGSCEKLHALLQSEVQEEEEEASEKSEEEAEGEEYES